MWKVYSNALRKTIVLALEEATRAGHDRTRVEHLLLAMTRDKDASAARMLHYCGIDSEKLQRAVESDRSVGIAHHPPETDNAHPPEVSAHRDMGLRPMPATLSTGQRPVSRGASNDVGDLILDDHALQLLDSAKHLADARNDKPIGNEHLLLAILESSNGDLDHLHISLADTRPALLHWIDSGLVHHRWGPTPKRVRSLLARTFIAPIDKLTRAGVLTYRVFAKLSLGHPRFASNPYPLYHKLRNSHPLRRDPIAPVWVALRYDDVVTVLRDPRFRKEPFLSDALSDVARAQFGLPEQRDATIEGEPLAMLFLDPPRHTRIRSVFNQAFVPRTLNRLRPRIQHIADELLDRVAANGELDVIRDLAVPMPIRVISELVGFPPEDYEQLKKWSDDFAAALTINPSEELQSRSMQSREQMRGYFEKVVANLRENPQENLICTLLEANKDGALLTPMELFANCTLLMAAGHETTTNLIGNGVHALLQNLEQLKLLREDPALISSAIDELLRYDCPVQWIARVANEDLELRGQKIARGDVVVGSLGSSNRDPDIFDHPDQLNIRRKNNKHIAFGHGEHYCIGAMLARMEGEIAIGTMVKRFENLRLKSKRVKWNRNIIFRGLRELMVTI